jgi:hypothetical protein
MNRWRLCSTEAKVGDPRVGDLVETPGGCVGQVLRINDAVEPRFHPEVDDGTGVEDRWLAEVEGFGWYRLSRLQRVEAMMPDAEEMVWCPVCGWPCAEGDQCDEGRIR